MSQATPKPERSSRQLLAKNHGICLEQLEDWLTFRQHWDRAAGVVEKTLSRVDIQDFINRRQQMSRFESPLDRMLCFGIGGSDDDSASQAAASHHRGDRVAPVVSPRNRDARLTFV